MEIIVAILSAALIWLWLSHRKLIKEINMQHQGVRKEFDAVSTGIKIIHTHLGTTKEQLEKASVKLLAEEKT